MLEGGGGGGRRPKGKGRDIVGTREETQAGSKKSRALKVKARSLGWIFGASGREEALHG